MYEGYQLQYNGQTAIDAAVDGNLPLIVLLWQQASKFMDVVNSPDASGTPPLHWAAYHGHLPICRFLVSKGAKVNFQAGAERTTALHWAAGAGHLGVIDFLLANGADPSIADGKGYCACMHAAQYGRILAIFLIKTRAPHVDIKRTDMFGHTIVHWAAYKGFPNTLRFLVERYGVAVNIIDDQNRTALHWAAREGFLECCKFLISKGCNIACKDKDDHTALLWAQEMGHLQVAHFLEQCAKHGSGHAIADASLQTGGSFESSTWRVLREDYKQRRIFLMVTMGIWIHYFFLSWWLPVAFSLVLPALAYLGPQCVRCILRRPVPKNDGPQRQLWCLALSLNSVGCIYLTVLLSPLMDFALREWPVGSTVATSAAIAALLTGGYTVMVDPGFLECSKLFDGDSELFRAVDRGDFKAVESEQHSSDCQEVPSLRGHYCRVVSRSVTRFDHFNQCLGVPIGLRNHRAYVLFLAFLLSSLGSILFLTYAFTKSLGPTSAHPEALPAEVKPSSTCRFLISFLWTGIPTMGSMAISIGSTLPTLANHLSLWLLFYNGAVCLALFAEFGLQLALISFNITFHEAFESSKFVKQRSSFGMQQSVFSKGLVANCKAFWGGQ
eukprot:GGOE01036830.1.p1 GENE.GGOE01036830.1~~GGOE01036830.1.p1  ORF type:complete len:653 (-),score=86.84 GGOE01036830.1:34-1866(-)